MVLISIFILIFFNFENLPWVGLTVALSWAFYNLVRKTIKVDTDIGLLVESLYILPFALITFYFIFLKKRFVSDLIILIKKISPMRFGIAIIPNMTSEKSQTKTRGMVAPIKTKKV